MSTATLNTLKSGLKYAFAKKLKLWASNSHSPMVVTRRMPSAQAWPKIKWQNIFYLILWFLKRFLNTWFHDRLFFSFFCFRPFMAHLCPLYLLSLTHINKHTRRHTHTKKMKLSLSNFLLSKTRERFYHINGNSIALSRSFLPLQFVTFRKVHCYNCLSWLFILDVTT